MRTFVSVGSLGSLGVIVAAALLAGGCSSTTRDLAREGGPSGARGTAWVVTSAVCQLLPTEGNDCRGTVTFDVLSDGVLRITANVTGLRPDQAHGFHIHEFGDLSAPDASSAGSHYAPVAGHPHAGPDQLMKHAGDLGNLVADAQGVARMEVAVQGISLTGEHPVLGRAVIVHAEADDLTSQPSGASGARIGAGVIGIARP